MRGKRSLRDFTVLVWLVAAAIIAIVHRWVPESTWLMVHLVGLGAITHSVMVWSAHFTAALLKTRPDDNARKLADVRLGAAAIGALMVFVGVPTTLWPLVLAGAVLVSVAVLWHAITLVRDLKRALPGRFRISIRYYVAAAICVPVAAGFGTALAWGLGDQWHANLLVAHSLTMILGWVGLTLVGTLVTFWPTVLRTRMDDRAEKLARQTLPILIGGLAVIIGASLLGFRPVAAVGIVIYAVGLVWFGRCLIAPARKAPPREFASASILAACLWACVALIATAVHVGRSDDIELATDYSLIAGIWVVGFLLQLVTGALSYLLPSVLGGGPRVVRAGGAYFNKWTSFRLTVINAGLIVFLLPLSSWAKVTVSVTVLVALMLFLPLMIAGIRASVKERKAAAAGVEASAPVDRTSSLTGSGLVAGIAALAVALSLGFGMDPGAAGIGGGAQQGTEAVAPTGRTVRVEVSAHDMRYEPASVQVDPGDHVIIELTNHDQTNLHDLMVGDVRSPRLAFGETAELDLGVVGQSIEGWCTVVGHRQMGMTFDVLVGDSAPATSGGHTMHQPAVGDPDAELSRIVDPTAPERPSGTLHRHEFRVTEEPLEVAPGLWQRRWTFNGESVGPALRGKVGDTFEITLINDGTMGHSIDFHAGDVAPDEPMRTIAPGESLVYRFTAKRSGVWLYHCSTAPMSAHIAAGMHGAVIIEPKDGWPEVDREYVVVQSEVYTYDAATAEEATDIDAARVMTDQPDKVVFNGVARQYAQQPFEARVGEKVRFFVVDAGPSRALSFHIVGGQFDTVYREGGYLLLDGADPYGNAGGGAQALALQAAEGGFVELTFVEEGNYPVVNHIMIDAERGAYGIVKVTS